MGKLFYFYVGPTVTDICAKFHVNVIICYIVTLVFSKRLQVIFSIFTMCEFCWAKKCHEILFAEWNFSCGNVQNVAEGLRWFNYVAEKCLCDTKTSKKAEIKELVHKNRQLTIRDLADTIGISRGSLDTVSKDILGR